MAGIFWIVVVLAVVMGAVAMVLLVHWVRQIARQSSVAEARKNFHVQREHLEAKFFEMAASSGKPRGLEWVSCDFDDDVSYARDRQSGELAAFVAITISFAAVEGGGMEEVEAVGNLRAATAVFQFADGKWRTDGRAIFNLNPAEAIRHFQSSLEMVAHDHPAKA